MILGLYPLLGHAHTVTLRVPPPTTASHLFCSASPPVLVLVEIILVGIETEQVADLAFGGVTVGICIDGVGAVRGA